MGKAVLGSTIVGSGVTAELRHGVLRILGCGVRRGYEAHTFFNFEVTSEHNPIDYNGT